jgi:hypothetical protein
MGDVPPAFQAGQWAIPWYQAIFFRVQSTKNHLTGYDYHQKDHLPG